jgi:hypothetical protein
MTVRVAAGVVVGAILGYGYHRLVGCRTGTCPIVANPWASTVYGALIGWLAMMGRPA